LITQIVEIETCVNVQTLRKINKIYRKENCRKGRKR